MKTDKRGRIRFTKYGFRFETTITNPTTVTIYAREGDNYNKERKLGIVNLEKAAFRLFFGTQGDAVVRPSTPSLLTSEID